MADFIPIGMQGCNMEGWAHPSEGDRALQYDLDGVLSDTVDWFTDPNVGIPTIRHVFWASDGRVLVVLGGARKCRDKGDLYLVSGKAEEGRQWTPVQVEGAFVKLDQVWASDKANSLLIQKNDNIQLITVNLDDVTGEATQLDRFPAHAIESYCVYHNGTLYAACIVEKPDERSDVFITPAPLRTRSLYHVVGENDWKMIDKIPITSEYLHMSRTGKRMAFRATINTTPEEAERGEYFVADDKKGSVRQLTKGCQRTELVRLSNDGGTVYYMANCDADYCITAHMTIRKLPFYSTMAQGEEITTTQESIEDFGCAGDDHSLWVSAVHNGTRVLYLMDHLGGEAQVRKHATSSPVSANADGTFAYATQSTTDYPSVYVGGTLVPVDTHKAFDTYQVQVVEWTASDGLKICGWVCDTTDMPTNAPVITHVHGGPVSTQFNDRTSATNCTRYPYRSLIAAGYRVFMPLYRGSNSVSDAFSQANIRKQGVQDGGDLGDILSGLDHLVSAGLVDKNVKHGIWGGSYGGYMTNHAIAHTKRFGAGVSMYGYVDNRMMSAEGGDLTWEEEYFGKISWPRAYDNSASNNYEHLHTATAPCLFMHGELDDICPVSQSRIGYNILHIQKIPTGLIVYPGEGHGFDEPAHQRDRDRRVILWFDQHLRGVAQ